MGNYWQSELKDPRDNFFQLVINQQEIAYNKVIITLNHYRTLFTERLRLEVLNPCLMAVVLKSARGSMSPGQILLKIQLSGTPDLDVDRVSLG